MIKSIFVFFKKHRTVSYLILLCLISYIAWGKVQEFWFFRGYEAAWLMNMPHTIQGLFRAHAYLYYLNYLLFGWNPSGWYTVSIVLHTATSIIAFFTILVLTNVWGIAVIGSIIFSASITYHDVVTWGSFNSYYSLLMICLLTSLLLYIYFRNKNNILYLLISVFFAFCTFYIRESGLVLIGLIGIYEVIFHKKKKFTHFIYDFRYIIPFFLAAGLYFYIRRKFGDIAGDYADDCVQLRLKLIKERSYHILLWRMILAFGRHISSLFIPYPWLNIVRMKTGIILKNVHGVEMYFFTLIGWIQIVCISLYLYIRRKSHFLRIYVFSFVWMIVFILMTAYAIPSTDTVLTQEFIWNTRRYTYYAFFGASLFIATIFWEIHLYVINRFNKRYSWYIVPIAVCLVVGINIVWLRSIESYLLRTVHSQSKQFYSDFHEYFPTLPDTILIYQYPYSYILNDFLFEWSLTREEVYPNLSGKPFNIENQYSRVLEKIVSGIQSPEDIIFLDYNINEGLIDKTEKAKEVFGKVKEIPFTNRNGAEIEYGLAPIEIPYVLEFSVKASPGIQSNHPVFQNNISDARDYGLYRIQFLQNTHATVSATMSQRPGEPFLHIVPDNLIDGNFGARSGWIADSNPAVITLDLGRIQDTAGVLWSSQEGPRLPSSYRIFISEDGVIWKMVYSKKDNNASSVVDIFESVIPARYVRMSIDTTNNGAFVYLDEVEAISDSGVRIFEEYTNVRDFIEDTMFISGIAYSWIRINWNTNKTYSDTAPQMIYFPIIADGSYHTYSVQLPEMEIFARNGEFLEKYITGIRIDPVGPYDINVQYGTLKPYYEIINPQ